MTGTPFDAVAEKARNPVPGDTRQTAQTNPADTTDESTSVYRSRLPPYDGLYEQAMPKAQVSKEDVAVMVSIGSGALRVIELL